MTFELPARSRTAKLFIALACALLIGGSAYAVTSANFTYAARQVGFVSVSSMALAPDNNDDVDYDNSWASGLSTTGQRCFNTGLNFPQGARLVNATVWYRSGNGSNVRFVIYRHRLSDGDTDVVIDSTIANNSNTHKARTVAVEPSTAIVQNQSYDFGFGVCLGPGDVFHSARVRYTYTSAGD